MSIQHADIVDPFIHEPKGISTASGNTVYRADGSGSGVWTTLGWTSLDAASILGAIQDALDNANLTVEGRFYVTVQIDDVSTADSVIVPVIPNATLIGASVVLGDDITDADATVTFTNSAAASMGSPVTIAFSGSAKGDQYAFTATGNNTFSGPSWMEIATDGGSTGTARLYVTLEFEHVIN